MIHHVENEILYSINIETNNVKQIKWKKIFSTYYYIEDDTFSLYSKGTKYQFTYNELKELEFHKEKKDQGNILSNWQGTLLYYTKEKELLYNNKTIPNPPIQLEEYKIGKNLILGYSEKYLFSYNHREWNMLYEVDDKFSIRECMSDLNDIYILVNNKSDTNQSLVKVISQA